MSMIFFVFFKTFYVMFFEVGAPGAPIHPVHWIRPRTVTRVNFGLLLFNSVLECKFSVDKSNVM